MGDGGEGGYEMEMDGRMYDDGKEKRIGNA